MTLDVGPDCCVTLWNFDEVAMSDFYQSGKEALLNEPW
jgi:hypothetical protein